MAQALAIAVTIHCAERAVLFCGGAPHAPYRARRRQGLRSVTVALREGQKAHLAGIYSWQRARDWPHSESPLRIPRRSSGIKGMPGRGGGRTSTSLSS